jgi:hypothetical protein
LAKNSIDRRTFLLGAGAVASIAELPALSTAAEAVPQAPAPAGVAAPLAKDSAEGRHEWKELYIKPPRANILSQ